jgi:hypothetical protein
LKISRHMSPARIDDGRKSEPRRPRRNRREDLLMARAVTFTGEV